MSKTLGIVEKATMAVKNDPKFFDVVRRERGVGAAFKYLAVLSTVYVVGYAAYFALMSWLMPDFALLGPAVLAIMVAMIYVSMLVGWFIGAGIYHLLIRLFGGKGDYATTYRTMVYTYTPMLLFGWIPLVGLVASLYSLYLFVKGVSKLHRISVGRTILALFGIPIAIAVVVAIGGILSIWLIYMAAS
jgi:hypothetical protein